jgi:hypothetical protein
MSFSVAQLKRIITNRQWYHQRFDGSPMFLFAAGEAEIKKEPQIGRAHV